MKHIIVYLFLILFSGLFCTSTFADSNSNIYVVDQDKVVEIQKEIDFLKDSNVNNLKESVQSYTNTMNFAVGAIGLFATITLAGSIGIVFIKNREFEKIKNEAKNKVSEIVMLHKQAEIYVKNAKNNKKIANKVGKDLMLQSKELSKLRNETLKVYGELSSKSTNIKEINNKIAELQNLQNEFENRYVKSFTTLSGANSIGSASLSPSSYHFGTDVVGLGNIDGLLSCQRCGKILSNYGDIKTTTDGIRVCDDCL